jgi:hypothetical protein
LSYDVALEIPDGAVDVSANTDSWFGSQGLKKGTRFGTKATCGFYHKGSESAGLQSGGGQGSGVVGVLLGLLETGRFVSKVVGVL